MSKEIELTNYGLSGYCLVNLATDEIEFYNTKTTPGFTGLYFKDDKTFFALYPTEDGPKIYFEGQEHPIHPSLHITLAKDGKNRTFRIQEYGIVIDYIESEWIGWDVWSDEIDVDLFFMLEQSYKTDEFYERYTK